MPYVKWMEFVNNNMPSDLGTINYAGNKIKKAAMFISNCQTSNKRMNYVKELSNY
jgi:hypothetical protein